MYIKMFKKYEIFLDAFNCKIDRNVIPETRITIHYTFAHYLSFYSKVQNDLKKIYNRSLPKRKNYVMTHFIARNSAKDWFNPRKAESFFN